MTLYCSPKMRFTLDIEGVEIEVIRLGNFAYHKRIEVGGIAEGRNVASYSGV
jgi:hypothetical protein